MIMSFSASSSSSANIVTTGKFTITAAFFLPVIFPKAAIPCTTTTSIISTIYDCIIFVHPIIFIVECTNTISIFTTTTIVYVVRGAVMRCLMVDTLLWGAIVGMYVVAGVGWGSARRWLLRELLGLQSCRHLILRVSSAQHCHPC